MNVPPEAQMPATPVCRRARRSGGTPVRCPLIPVVAALAALAPSAQQPVFRSGLDLVTLGVGVSDRRGTLVTDLTVGDFEVYEDGKPQVIRFFASGTASGDADASRPELHLGALLDISGSMDEDMKTAKSAALKFLHTLDEAVDVTFVDFDTEVRVAQFSRQSFPHLVERVRTRKAEGYTALYDAIGVYLDTAAAQQGRKVLVLYTDGGDNSSNITFSETLTLLKASDVTVYSIGFLEHAPSSMRVQLRMQLEQIAELTGGRFLNPASMKELESAFEKVRDEIAAQYTLGYVSANTKADGSWRKVEVKLVGPALKDLRLRSRRGYYALYKDRPPGGRLQAASAARPGDPPAVVVR